MSVETRLSNWAVLRAAAWPIETAQTFAAPDLARAADNLCALERDILARRDCVVAALHAAVPLADSATRRRLLTLKRHVHATTDPYPVDTPAVALAPIVREDAEARRELGDRRREYAVLYAETLESQRHNLRRLTSDRRFQRALIVANLPVAKAWSTGEPPRRAKRRRHLETTVFHYLMRACGRATPNGAWAGVASVVPVDDARVPFSVETAPPVYQVQVNLQPFALMLRWLSKQARYRWGRALHANPTLGRDAVGGWRYEQNHGGVRRWVSVPPQPLVAAIIDAYTDGGPRAAAPLIEALANVWPEQAGLRGTLERLVEWLVDRDVLQTDLGLPGTADTAWSALQAVTGHLDAADRATWHAVIERVRDACDRMAAEFDRLSAAELETLLTEVEAEVQRLWNAVGLGGSPPRPAVYVDMRLPFHIAWDPRTREAARIAVTSLLGFHASDGGAELFRRQTLRDIVVALANCGGGAVPIRNLIHALDWRVPPRPRTDIGLEHTDTLEFVLGQSPPDSDLGKEARAYCARWDALFAAAHAQPCFTLPPPEARRDVLHGPAGAVLLWPTGDGEFWLGPARPDVALFAARFGGLLDEELHTTLRDGIHMSDGVIAAEISTWDTANPNAGLHRLVSSTTLDPHALADVAVQADTQGERVWLRRGDQLIAPLQATGADIGHYDVCSRLLLAVAHGHGWEFPSFQVPPTQAERSRWKHAPRLVLSGGEILRPERWTIEGDTLRALANLAGPERYLAWRTEICRVGAPPLVHVRTAPYEPELLLPTDSPLAVECLFDAGAGRAPWLELAELPGVPEHWPLRDAHGNHYMAELAVSWFTDQYWRAVAPTV